MDQQQEVKALEQKRIKFIKSAKALANNYLQENLKAKQYSHKKWEVKVIENNIEQLTRIRTKLNSDRHSKSLNRYVEAKLWAKEQYKLASIPVFLPGIDDFGLFFEISRYSYSYSIVNDMYWITDGTIGDHIEVITGQKSVEFFGEYCEKVVEVLLIEVLPELNKQPYHQAAVLLGDICRDFGAQSYLSTNILLHSLIESLVRSLACFLYQRQNPLTTQDETWGFVEQYQSLERLIIIPDWKDDIELSFEEALFRSRYIKYPSLEVVSQIHEQQVDVQQRVQTITEEMLAVLTDSATDDETKRQKAFVLIAKQESLAEKIVDRKSLKIKVSLKVELQFLLRRHKENRNAIVHGNFTNFDKKWYCYLNLSAVAKIARIIQAYEGIYAANAITGIS